MSNIKELTQVSEQALVFQRSTAKRVALQMPCAMDVVQPEEHLETYRFNEVLLEAVYLHAPDVSSILQRQPPTIA